MYNAIRRPTPLGPSGPREGFPSSMNTALDLASSPSNIISDVINFAADGNGLMVIVPAHISHILIGCLTEQLAFLLSLRMLPRVFDHQRHPWGSFAMGSPASCRPASYARC